ncbi:unnamed protein product [Linum trigynum]|uniref:PGG domain-containing protein n=1 Tax=Linum trigynum TaxID=586398 RepID=A0AAV2EUX9_9ROSI
MGSPLADGCGGFHEDQLDAIRRELFQSAMKGDWRRVIHTYRTQPSAYAAQITKPLDTALHIAVSDGQERCLEQLVEIMYGKSGAGEEAGAALRVRNDHGNTPLHIAAALGNVRMCVSIAGRDKALVGVRNDESETPLFLAAVHGMKEAFLRMHQICGAEDCRRHYRGKDGETILHVAIAGEYFELAYQIIVLYKELVNAVNTHGKTPLHLLASKPGAFRSGSHVGGYHQLIYYCTFVDLLQPEMPRTYAGQGAAPASSYVPPNYETCVSFLALPLDIVKSRFKQSNAPSEDAENQRAPSKQSAGSQQLLPSNYDTCFEFVKLAFKSLFVILGYGSTEMRKIRMKKEKHVWSVQIMNELLKDAETYVYEYNGRSPHPIGTPLEFSDLLTAAGDHDINKPKHLETIETPMLIAAKNGITEIVEKILDLYPVAINDMNAGKKNIVLLAVENRQSRVYERLLKRGVIRESVFRKVDNRGNSALHLAAALGHHKPWRIPGAALQMQWEIKWYEFVKNSMPYNFFIRHNKEGKTPRDIFSEEHADLVKSGGEWLISTSESCSVVAALIATVAFATSSTVPGGVEPDGKPTLEGQPAFHIFAISSLVALCFSVTSLVMFLSILTSRFQEKDFGRDLPRKLLIGLSSLFVSIAAVLVSFCAGHFFVLRDELKYAAYPVYALTCLPVSFFAVAQFPLYVDLVRATFQRVPRGSYMVVPP